MLSRRLGRSLRLDHCRRCLLGRDSLATFSSVCRCWLRRSFLRRGSFGLRRWLRQSRDLTRLVLIRHRGGLAEQVDHDHAVLDLLHAAGHDLAYGEGVTLVAT